MSIPINALVARAEQGNYFLEFTSDNPGGLSNGLPWPVASEAPQFPGTPAAPVKFRDIRLMVTYLLQEYSEFKDNSNMDVATASTTRAREVNNKVQLALYHLYKVQDRYPVESFLSIQLSLLARQVRSLLRGSTIVLEYHKLN